MRAKGGLEGEEEQEDVCDRGSYEVRWRPSSSSFFLFVTFYVKKKNPGNERLRGRGKEAEEDAS